MALASDVCVEQVMRQLRDRYCLLRRLREPHYTPSAKDEPNWLRFAHKIIARDVNGADYAQWAYTECINTTRQPLAYPNQIRCDKLLNSYVASKSERADAVLLKIRLSIDILTHELKRGRDPYHIVDDRFLDLSPLFRYALARKAGLSAQAQQFEEMAELEMLGEPLLRQFLTTYLA